MPIRRTPRPAPAGDAGAAPRVGPEELSGVFAAPAWLRDLGVKDGSVKAELQKSVPEIGGALIGGVTTGIRELSSVVMLVTVAVFTTRRGSTGAARGSCRPSRRARPTPARPCCG